MNAKQLIKLAGNSDAMYLLEKIQYLQSNYEHQTIYSQKSYKKEMKEKALEIIGILNHTDEL